MGAWNTGSVGAAALLRFENVPTTLSGALPGMAEMAITRVNNYTGQSIGTTGIAEKWQPAILYFTLSELASEMALVGADKTYSLGELSVEGAGKGSSLDDAEEAFEKKAYKELASLGMKAQKYRTY